MKPATEEQKKAVTYHTQLWWRTTVKTNRWVVNLSEATYPFPFIKKIKIPLNNRLNNHMVAKSMTSKLCAQLEEQPINNSLLSNCLPASTKGLAVFSGIFAAEYWPTELLLGKPHLSKARNKTAPGTLEHSQKGTFSSVFYPVCVCVCVFAPRGYPASLK